MNQVTLDFNLNFSVGGLKISLAFCRKFKEFQPSDGTEEDLLMRHDGNRRQLQLAGRLSAGQERQACAQESKRPLKETSSSEIHLQAHIFRPNDFTQADQEKRNRNERKSY